MKKWLMSFCLLNAITFSAMAMENVKKIDIGNGVIIESFEPISSNSSESDNITIKEEDIAQARKMLEAIEQDLKGLSGSLAVEGQTFSEFKVEVTNLIERKVASPARIEEIGKKFAQWELKVKDIVPQSFNKINDVKRDKIPTDDPSSTALQENSIFPFGNNKLWCKITVVGAVATVAVVSYAIWKKKFHNKTSQAAIENE